MENLTQLNQHTNTKFFAEKAFSFKDIHCGIEHGFFDMKHSTAILLDQWPFPLPLSHLSELYDALLVLLSHQHFNILLQLKEFSMEFYLIILYLKVRYHGRKMSEDNSAVWSTICDANCNQ